MNLPILLQCPVASCQVIKDSAAQHDFSKRRSVFFFLLKNTVNVTVLNRQDSPDCTADGSLFPASVEMQPSVGRLTHNHTIAVMMPK